MTAPAPLTPANEQAEEDAYHRVANTLSDHDEHCEAEWESGAMAYTPCGCAHRAIEPVVHSGPAPDWLGGDWRG